MSDQGVRVVEMPDEMDLFLEIVYAAKVVGKWNPPMADLAGELQTWYPDALVAKPAMADAVRNGSGVFEALEKQVPKFAQAVHDVVYLILHPFGSITIKDITRERVAKAVLDL